MLAAPKISNEQSMSPVCKGLILCAGMAGIAEVAWTSQWGLPVSPDGLVYLSAAQSFADGYGFLNHPQPDGNPVMHYPPLYSFLISLLLMGGVSLNLAPIILNAVFIFVFLVSLGWILFRLTQSPIAGIAGAWVGWLGPGIYPWFAYPWTEPLFLLTSLWGLYFLARYLASERMPHLLAAGFLLGMAYLTRYIGVSLWFTGVLGILLFSARPAKPRLYATVVFAILAGSPMGFWLLRNWLLTGHFTDRIKSFHPKPFAKLFEMSLTFQPWLGVHHSGFPSFRSLWFALFVITLLILIWKKWIRPSPEEQISHNSYQLKNIALIAGSVFILATFLSIYFQDTDPFILLGKLLLGKGTSVYLLESLPVLFVVFLFSLFVIPNLRTPFSKNHEKVSSLFIKILVLYATFYFLFLVISMTWYDSTTRFLPRILSPWFVIGLILVIVAATRFAQNSNTTSFRNSFFRYLSPLAILILLGSYSVNKLAWWDNALKVGLGDINREWRASSFASPVNPYEKPPVIYSNFPVAYFFLTGQRVEFKSLMHPPLNPESENILYVHLSLFDLKPKPGSEVHWRWIYKDDKSIWFVPRDSEILPTF